MRTNIEHDGCWEWTGGKNSSGYGVVTLMGKTMGAHRLSYILFHGALRKHDFVCHTCDNPPCINPNHLFRGSAADNTQDSVKKGRHRNPVNQGEDHPLAKLTWDEVSEIRARWAEGESQTYLASIYSMSQASISNIVHNRTWKMKVK